MEACHNCGMDNGHVSECDDSDDSEEKSSDEGPVEESFPLLNRAMQCRQGSKDETTNTMTDWPVRSRVCELSSFVTKL